MHFREFLTSPIAYLAPEKILEELSDTDAQRQIAGAPHSIAEIVAHLTFWQDWFYARCSGELTAMAASAAVGWPAVDGGSWPTVRSRFVDRLQQLTALADGDTTKLVDPAIEFPPLAQYSIADVLVHVATHNSHHLGQVILMRQMMGLWPPPSGSWTW